LSDDFDEYGKPHFLRYDCPIPVYRRMMKQNLDRRSTLIFIFLGVLLLGTGPMFVKYVRAHGVLVSFYRLLFAGLMLVIPAWMQRPSGEELAQKRTSIGWLFLGGASFALNISLWCSALNYTTAAAVTLLDNTAPIWVGLFSWLFLKEKLGKFFWIGLGIALSGAALLIGFDLFQGSAGRMQGNVLGVISGLSYAMYILVTRQARKRYSSLIYSCAVPLVGAGILFVINLALGYLDQPLPWMSLVMIFLMALTSQVIGWLLINHAVGHLPASAASVALVGQTMVASILGAIIFNEVLSGSQLAGGLLCLSGIILAQRTE